MNERLTVVATRASMSAGISTSVSSGPMENLNLQSCESDLLPRMEKNWDLRTLTMKGWQYGQQSSIFSGYRYKASIIDPCGENNRNPWVNIHIQLEYP